MCYIFVTDIPFCRNNLNIFSFKHSTFLTFTGMEVPILDEASARGKKQKTKGILKNPGERGSKKHRKHAAGSPSGRHVEITPDTPTTHPTEKRHKSKKHRDSSNIYDTPKVSSVKWKEDLTAAYERSRRKDRPVSAVNTSLISGTYIECTK